MTRSFLIVIFLLTARLAPAQSNAISQSVKKSEVEALTGVSLKEPAFEDYPAFQGTIGRYRAVKPRAYDAEVCIISLQGIAPDYGRELKRDQSMGFKGTLTGLGDQAYWTDLGQGVGAYTKVAVWKGKKFLSVTLTDSRKGLARLEAAKQLAHRLLSHL